MKSAVLYKWFCLLLFALRKSTGTCNSLPYDNASDNSVLPTRINEEATHEGHSEASDRNFEHRTKGGDRNEKVVQNALNNQETSNGAHWRNHWTPLHSAAAGGEVKVVKDLLIEGAMVDVRDDGQCTPLHYAAWYGCVKVAKVLLHRGADIEATDSAGHTPLHRAAECKDSRIVKVLLRKGANIEAIDDCGWSPLVFAAAHLNMDTVEILLDEGANVQVIEGAGLTALHFAAKGGRVDIVQMLLYSGASKTVKDMYGKTPRDMVCLDSDVYCSTYRKLLLASLLSSDEDHCSEHYSVWRILLIICSSGFLVLLAMLLAAVAWFIIYKPSLSFDKPNST